MPLKLFISYSRRDKTAAQGLVRSLVAEGFEVFIDLEALEFGEEWQRQLAQSIASADTVVWLVSPASVTSRWCQWELDEVVRLSKRLMPVRLAEVDIRMVPAAIGRVHMLPAEGVYESDQHLPLLVRALNTDSAWIREGTALLERARQWRPLAESDAVAPPPEDASALLTGAQLHRADDWRKRQPSQAPAPAREVVELILASHEAQWRRRTWGAAALLGVVAIATTAWWQWGAAQQRRTEALVNQSRQLLGAADQALAGGDAVRAALLTLEAMPDPSRGIERPLVPDAEGRLYAAMQAQREERVIPDPAQHTIGVMPLAPASAVPVLGQDHVLRLLDAEKGLWGREHHGPTAIPLTTNWSAAGQRLLVTTVAFGDVPALAYLWDTGQPALIGALVGHSAEVRASAFSGDGKRLAVADAEGVVSVHDSVDGRLLRRWEYGGWVDTLALDSQGRWLAGSDWQGAVLWDAATGRLHRRLGVDSKLGVKALYFAGGGRELVAVRLDGRLHRWKLTARSGSTVPLDCQASSAIQAHPQQVGASALGGNGLATGGNDGGVALWHLRDSCTRGDPDRVQLDWPVQAVDVGANGDTVLVHTRDEQRGTQVSNALHLWTPRSRLAATELRGHSDLAGMALLAGGDRLLTHGGGKLGIWRTTTLGERTRLLGSGAPMRAVRVSPGGERALSHGPAATAWLWDPVADTARVRLPTGGTQVLASAFSKGGHTAYLFTDNGELSRWRATDGQALGRRVMPGSERSVAAQFTSDGGRLFVAHGAGPGSLLDTESGRLLAKLEASTDPPPGAALSRHVARAAFSGDGRWLVTATEWARPMEPAASGPPGNSQSQSLRLDSGVRLWNAQTGARLGRISASGDTSIESFVASVDGTQLAVGLRAGRVNVFSLPDGRLLHDLELSGAKGTPRWTGLTFSPDGRWLAGSYGGEGQVWDLKKDARPLRLARGIAEVGMPTFTPDSRQLLTRDGRSVRVWNPETGEPRFALEGHRNDVSDTAFDPQGRWVLSASLDQDLRRWPLYATVPEFQAHAWSSLPRCLTDEERAQLALAPATGACPATGPRR